jgi:hypothetical protein
MQAVFGVFSKNRQLTFINTRLILPTAVFAGWPGLLGTKKAPEWPGAEWQAAHDLVLA